MATTVIDRFVTEMLFRGNAMVYMSKLDAAVAKSRARLEGLSRTAGATGLVLTAAAGKSLMSFRAYEKSMAMIEGQVGISQAQIAKWHEGIKQIAKDTGRSPQELLEAMFDIASAGYRGSEALDVLRASAEGAGGALGETKELASLSTSAVNAYGAENLTAAQVIDALAEAVKEGKVEAQEFSASLGRIIPIASNMGVEIQEVMGLLAGMSKTGTGATEGVVALTGIMRAFLKPTSQGQKVLEAYGMTYADLRKTMADDGVIVAVGKLKDAFGDGANAIELMGQVINESEALKGVLDLTGTGRDENVRIVNALSDSTGERLAALEAQRKTLDFRILRLSVLFDSALIDMGMRLKSSAVSLIESIEGVVEWFEGLSEQAKSLLAKVLSLGPALLGVSVIAKVLAWALYPLMKAVFAVGGVIVWFGARLVALTAWLGGTTAGTWLYVGASEALLWTQKKALVLLGALKTRLLALAAATGLVTAYQWLLNTALFANPVGLFILALVALIAAFGLVWVYWDEIIAFLGNAVSGIFDWIGDAFQWMLEGILGGIPDWLTNLFDGKAKKIVQVDGGFEVDGKLYDKDGKEINPAPAALGTAERLGIASAPLPVGSSGLSPAAAYAAEHGGQPGVNVSVGKIEVNAPGADGKEISKQVGSTINAEIEEAVNNNDSLIVR